MKVEKINYYKDLYKVHLKSDDTLSELFKYDSLMNFQSNWDLEALDFKDMFNRSFSSKISGRLWGGSVNSAKSIMLTFIEKHKEFVRSMFRDLLDEKKDVVMRMKRFTFHCDQLLRELQDIDKKVVVHRHNLRMISVYLGFVYPNVYTIYDYKSFAKCLKLFESKNVIEEFEIDKFFTMSRTLLTILSKDEELVDAHRSRIKSSGVDIEDSLLLVHDFIEFNFLLPKSRIGEV